MPADQQSVHRQAEADSESNAISALTVHTDTGALWGFSRDIPCCPQGVIHMTVQQAALSQSAVPEAVVWTVSEEVRGQRLPEGKSHGLLP